MNACEQSVAAEDPWMSLMRRGAFEQAWRLSDRLLERRRDEPCWHWPRHLQYVWDGSSLEGQRVLIRCYHGLGDTIQFIRYCAEVRRIAREVLVWAQPSLIPLLERVEGIDQLWPLHDGTPEFAYDVDVEVMELPYVFRTSLRVVPRHVPYIFCEPTSPLRGDGTRLNVGVVWRSGDWDERRSMPASLMAGLADIPGIELHVLQHRAAAAEWPPGIGKLVCPEPVAELARTIAAMDLLITIDSLAAHLGGALAVPTWTLLPTAADWRWMEHRDDSPWYPTMRLWRQERSGDWPAVMLNVKRELQRSVRAGVWRNA